MEACKPLHSGSGINASSLLRLLRGVLCLLVLISTAFMVLVYGGFVGAVIIRIVSIHYSRKSTSVFFGAWLALWPLLFEKINGTKVIFSGENLHSKERVVLIANHRTEVDWMYLWDLALRKGQLGYIKYVLKDSLMKIPVFGWAFHILEFIPVKRRWDLDESKMRQMLASFKDPKDPLWLAVFPEGTDFTEMKCIRSQKYAAEKGLPVLKNVLLPKKKGFSACMEELRGSIDAVYDITIGYKPRCPFFMDNVFGSNPSEVHIHARQILPTDIPASEEGVASWLMESFILKDKLLTEFYATGHFPSERTNENELSLVKCLVNFTFVMTFTGLCGYLTFCSHVWFKIYVTLACIYLATATSFDVRPFPIISFLEQRLRKSCLNTGH